MFHDVPEYEASFLTLIHDVPEYEASFLTLIHDVSEYVAVFLVFSIQKGFKTHSMYLAFL